MRGLFVSVEGCEGAGKSTFINALQKKISSLGYHVVQTCEPGGTPLGDAIRHLVLHETSLGSISPEAELLLFLASRAEHVARIIEPALLANSVVLCDRYIDSTIAYQGYGREKDPSYIEKLALLAVPLLPDCTFCIDINPLVAKHRLQERQGDRLDKIENSGQDFHLRVRTGFLSLAEKNPDRIVLLNGEDSVDQLVENAMKVLVDRLAVRVM